jgi:hypothetical protein
MFFHIQEGKL